MEKNDRVKRFEKLAEQYIPDEKIDLLIWLDNHGFFNAPASTKYHGNYDGGLADHSLEVAESLIELTLKLGLKW